MCKIMSFILSLVCLVFIHIPSAQALCKPYPPFALRYVMEGPGEFTKDDFSERYSKRNLGDLEGSGKENRDLIGDSSFSITGWYKFYTDSTEVDTQTHFLVDARGSDSHGISLEIVGNHRIVLTLSVKEGHSQTFIAEGSVFRPDPKFSALFGGRTKPPQLIQTDDSKNFHHFAVTVDRADKGVVIFYHDGVKWGQQSSMGGFVINHQLRTATFPNPDTGAVFVGEPYTQDNETLSILNFPGRLTQVAITKRVFTDEQIAQMHKCGDCLLNVDTCDGQNNSID